MRHALSFSIALLALALAGCTMVPKYHRPAPAIADAWPKPPESVAAPTNTVQVPAAELGWRDFFHEPRLQKLIQLALTNNPDLRVAVLNVEQLRAQYRISRAALFPTIDATATGSRQRYSFGYTGAGGAVTFDQYNVSIGSASYELDLFGRVRSLKEQALEKYFASQENQRSAQIALIAQVAGAYLTERELTEQLDVAQETLKSVQAAYKLTKRSYEVGVDSELDLRAAEAQVQTARGNVASLEQQLALAQNNLVLLVGRPLPKDLPSPQPITGQKYFVALPAGLPSDLLQRRPDILAAEHDLKAANANIGAARAAFFPIITLTASGGTTSTALEGLFAPGSQVWSFSPQIKLPLFEAGSRFAAYNAVKVSKLIQIQNYQKAIQTAFREVADALAVRTTVTVQVDAASKLVQAEQSRYQLAEARFRHGVDDYLGVLTAQQALYNAQQSLIQLRFSQLFNAINLYQDLGGGWQEHTPKDLAAAEKQG